jgi:hypothetical protein
MATALMLEHHARSRGRRCIPMRATKADFDSQESNNLSCPF